MGHLVDYETLEARGAPPKELALAALRCGAAKNSKRLAWHWAEIAAAHAEAAGISNAKRLLGGGRWPHIPALQEALLEVPE